MNEAFLDRTEGAEALTSEQGRVILERIRVAMSNATLEKLDPNLIRPMQDQPRFTLRQKHAKVANLERDQKLANSIASTGQIMPGIVRRMSESEGKLYELCDGERRYRAVLMSSVSFYRALVIDIDDEAAQYVVSVISNFNRQDHTLLELVDSVVKLHDHLGLTMPEIAGNIGYSKEYVQNLYGLRRLHPEVRDMLDPNLYKKTLSSDKAFAMMTLPPEHQFELAKKIMAGEIKGRFVRREIRKIAQINNLPVREAAVHPSDRRRSIESRIETVHEALEELCRIIKEPGAMFSVKEWPVFKFTSLQTAIKESTEHLEACEAFLTEALEEKKADSRPAPKPAVSPVQVAEVPKSASVPKQPRADVEAFMRRRAELNNTTPSNGAKEKKTFVPANSTPSHQPARNGGKMPNTASAPSVIDGAGKEKTVTFFDESLGRKVTDKVSRDKYLALEAAEHLGYQYDNKPRPDFMPTREEAIARWNDYCLLTDE